MLASSRSLRVIDSGAASALQSQTIWHALAYGVSETGQATLSFVQPAAPYVCLGYHRALEELDLGFCAAAGLPVFRRMVGGGPVYLDDDQLFFQIILPVREVPMVRAVALERLLLPAVQAFRECGVDASLRDGEICVGDRKICGHGAGQIADAVVVCGNLIGGFDHECATRILRLPDLAIRTEVERMMRRYVLATPAPMADFKAALISAYAAAFEWTPEPGEMSTVERAELVRLDREFVTSEWVTGQIPSRGPTIRIKIREGVRVARAQRGDTTLLVSSVAGTVVHAELTGVHDLTPVLGRRLGDVASTLRDNIPGLAFEAFELAMELAA